MQTIMHGTASPCLCPQLEVCTQTMHTMVPGQLSDLDISFVA